MRVIRVVLFVVLLCLLPIAGGAFSPGDVNITSTPDWAVAGGSSVKIQVHVMNMTLDNLPADGNISDASVTVIGNNNTLGTISPSGRITGSDGMLTIPFDYMPKTLKGDDQITFFISKNISGTLYNTTKTYIQKIDHAEPKYYSQIVYQSNAIVNKDTPVILQFTDIYGNTIDNRNIVEKISFRDSETGNGGFWDGTKRVNFIQENINDTGYVKVEYYLSSTAGNNVIYVSAPPTVISNNRFFTIVGLPDAPDSIISEITSTYDPYGISNEAVANGQDKFSIKYIVYDQYNNPVPELIISWTAEGPDVDLSDVFVTNSYGMVSLEYGPSTIVKDITLNAKVPGLAIQTDTIHFVPGGPIQMFLISISDTIPSREVDSESNSTIRAKLMDSIGRPMSDQTIHFVIESQTNSTNLTKNSSFEKDSDGIWETDATTNEFGIAEITFYPGAFPTKLQPELGYEPDATGEVIIRAEYDDITPSVTNIIYKNYPFLRVKTSVVPEEVAIGDTFNLTITLIGDGFNPPHKPIDAYLVFSRGLSMLDNRGQFAVDPIIYTRNAANIFMTILDPDTDQIGLWTYGDQGTADLLNNTEIKAKYLVGDDNSKNTSDDVMAIAGILPGYGAGYPGNPREYNDYATRDESLTDDFLEVYREVENIVPFNEEQSYLKGISLRYGTYRGVKDLLPSTAEVKAVVVLIDQEWNWFGDPLARNNGIVTDNPEGGAVSTPSNAFLAFDGTETYGSNPTGDYWTLTNYDTTTSWQNMSNYAKDNDIRIYVVSYTDSLKADRQKDLDVLAESTGGFHIHADDAEALEDAFDTIARELIVAASVNTELDLHFESINITYADLNFTKPGNQTFEYIYSEEHSTFVDSWNDSGQIHDELPVSPNGPYPSNAEPKLANGNITYEYWYDQSLEWENNNLQLFAGNISIGQTWEATFMFEALEAGIIDFFGDDSYICYKNDAMVDEDCFPMAKTTVIVNKTVNPELLKPGDIYITCHPPQPKDDATDLVNITWDMEYTGLGTIKQDLEYEFRPDSGSFKDTDYVKFAIVVAEGGPISPSRLYDRKLDVRDKLGYYKIRINAQETLYDGTPGSDKSTLCDYIINMSRKDPTILIE